MLKVGLLVSMKLACRIRLDSMTNRTVVPLVNHSSGKLVSARPVGEHETLPAVAVMV